MRTVWLDTNLVVLLVVGDVSEREVPTHKRLSGYEAEDYRLLLDVIQPFQIVSTLPNILTEASNILRQCPSHKMAAFGRSLERYANRTSETFQQSPSATRHPTYLRLGLTDAAILTAMNRDDHLVTADLDLYLADLQIGVQTTNFNHLRGDRRGV